MATGKEIQINKVKNVIPAGTGIVIVFFSCTVPAPLHFRHGFVKTEPWPLHLLQVDRMLKKPVDTCSYGFQWNLQLNILFYLSSLYALSSRKILIQNFKFYSSPFQRQPHKMENSQTHSNNSSTCRQIVSVCLIILWAWRLKG